jgi:hypothetical protein
MLKASVFLLYCLAVLTGVAGLFAGGYPLATYVLARWRSSAVDYELNFDFISKALDVFILSIILLIFVNISHVICCRFRRNSKKPVSSGRRKPDSSLPANSISQPAETSKEQPAEETPDEKLARLIIVKKK